MNKIFFPLAMLLCFALQLCAKDYEITKINPIFDKSTPFFGDFKIQVGLQNNTKAKKQINVTCLYTGLSHAGVYFKNEPQITKQYKNIELGPSEQKEIVFDKDFRAYHPEMNGEIIISIVGTGEVRSIPLQTRFHPNSKD